MNLSVIVRVCGHFDDSLCTGGSLGESFATRVVGIVKSRVNSMILLPTLPLTRCLYILVWFLHCKALHSISLTLIHPFPSLSGAIIHFLAMVVVFPIIVTPSVDIVDLPLLYVGPVCSISTLHSCSVNWLVASCHAMSTFCHAGL